VRYRILSISTFRTGACSNILFLQAPWMCLYDWQRKLRSYLRWSVNTLAHFTNAPAERRSLTEKGPYVAYGVLRHLNRLPAPPAIFWN
jgi:hypothetical protein